MSTTRLLGLLAVLAEQCGEQVSDARVEFMARKLLALGALEDVCLAVERLMETARKFPTVAEVKTVMGIADATPRDGALEIANRIFSAVVRYGEVPPGNFKTATAIEAALGPGTWDVVCKLGGWNRVVEMAGDNQTAVRAQIRDLAESYLRRGLIEQPTTAPLPSLGGVVALAAKVEAPCPRPALAVAERAALEQRLADLQTRRHTLLSFDVDEDRVVELRRQLKAREGLDS